MAQYTVEDIEILRQKSDISYEEAVNLLEYHNGSLARALVDLERNGRLLDSRTRPSAGKPGHKSRHHFWNMLFKLRVKVFKGDTPIINISVLFTIFSFLLAFWLVILSALAALLMGYRFKVERDAGEIGRDSLEDMLKHAGSNIRNTAFTVAKNLGAMSDTPKKEQPETPQAEEPEIRTESPVSGTTPVNVQFSEDGNVRITEDEDGYHEANIQ